jgi:outer membrane receptor protein involved in Fe transport
MNRLHSKRSQVLAAAFLGALLVLIPFQQAKAGRSRSCDFVGTVQDPGGSRVPGAQVQVRCANYETTQATDREGRFMFRSIPCATVNLTVRAAGFETFERMWQAGNPVALEVGLAPKILKENVTVTATFAREKGSESAADTTVLTRRDISATAAVTLDGALKQIPGFVLFRRTPSAVSNPTTQGVSLRGVGASGASRALVLYDGIPLNDPFGGWVYWDRIPREAIESVEVARGGFSSVYGDDAAGGVINIFPRHPMESSFSLDSSFGSEGTVDLSSLASRRKGRWIGTADGAAFRTDGYVLVDKHDRGSVDTPASSGHSSGSFELTSLISERSRAFARGELFGESRQNGTPLQRNRTHFRQLAAGADLLSAKGSSMVARAYVGSEVFDQTFSAVATDRNSEDLTDIQRVPSGRWGFSVHAVKPLGARQTMVAGLEGEAISGASDETIYRNGAANSALGAGGRQRVLGLFAEDIFRFGSDGVLTIGAREDDWRNFHGYLTNRPVAAPGPETVTSFRDRSENSFSPRLGIAYRVGGSLVLRASGYRAFRAPTLNELYRSFRVGNVVTQANSSLRAERLTGAETGASYRFFGDRASLRATYFWSELSRPIANVTLSVTPSLITRQRQNLGRTRTQGVELEFQTQLGSRWSLVSGYQFADARVTSFSANASLVGLLLPHVPRQEITVQTYYRGPRKVLMGIQARGVGKEFDDDQNQLALGGYIALDALVSRPLGHGLELFVAGENLLDNRYDVARTPVRTIGPPAGIRGGIRMAIH